MEGQLQKVVGRNLRAIRLEAGMSQEQFAVRLQWHRTYIGGLERGERNVTLRTLERLSDELGVRPVDLFLEGGEVGVTLDPDH